MNLKNVSVPHKKCGYCDHVLPITEFYSYLNKKGKRVYRKECSSCSCAVIRYNKEEKLHTILDKLKIKVPV